MSKLQLVQDFLQKKQDVQIVSVQEHNYFLHKDMYWTHLVSIITAPFAGIYTAKDLQKFLESLTPPGLPHSAVDNFREYDTTLEFGKLYFDEEIGQERCTRTITLTDTNFVSPDFVLKDKKIVLEEQRSIMRRIWVYLYPNLEIAEQVKNNSDLRHQISKRDLWEAQRNTTKFSFFRSKKKVS